MFLKQSTAVVIPFGPFVDKTDGVTLETGLVSALDHASTGIMLSKNGGTLAVRHATVTASTYDAHGCYKVTLDTTDTATLGQLRVIYTDPATCLAVWQDFRVVTANVWDSLHSTDVLDVSVTQLLGTAWLTPGVAGTPDVNAKLLGGTAQTGADVGATKAVIDNIHDTDLPAVKTDTAAILVDTGTTLDGRIPAALTTNGNMKCSLVEILTTALTETAGLLAGGFKKFFNVAVPTATCLSLPDAVPGAAGGLPTTNGTKLNQTADLTASQLVFKKNVARANFAFPMYDSTGALKTGLTVTAAIRKDAGASFAALAGSVTEIGTTGWYTVDWAQAETNADTIAFSASAAGANQTCYTILTQA